MDKVDILGVPFSKLNMQQTVRKISEHIQRKENTLFQVITANPEFVMAAERDPLIQKMAQEAEMITADGIGVVMASRWLGNPVAERVAGYDLLLQLLQEGSQQQWSVFIVGADQEVNTLATEKIRQTYPGLRIAGHYHGYFQDREAQLIEEIAEAKPDLLIAALGSPRQDVWIYKHKQEFGAKAAIGVGGSLDVIAGKVQRAPVFWQKLNLEWMYRLLSQPSRWRRQLALPRFALRALREAMGKR